MSEAPNRGIIHSNEQMEAWPADELNDHAGQVFVSIRGRACEWVNIEDLGSFSSRRPVNPEPEIDYDSEPLPPEPFS